MPSWQLESIVAKFNSHSSWCYWKHKLKKSTIYYRQLKSSKFFFSSHDCLYYYSAFYYLLSTATFTNLLNPTLSQLQRCTQCMHASMHGKCSYLNQTVRTNIHCHDARASCMHEQVSYSSTVDFHACTYE